MLEIGKNGFQLNRRKEIDDACPNLFVLYLSRFFLLLWLDIIAFFPDWNQLDLPSIEG